jgi:hypothetical protein
MTRRPQFHDSGARRSARYYLNHPRAPHLPPGPDLGPPGPDMGPHCPVSARGRPTVGRGRCQSGTPRGPKSGPLEPINRTTIRTGRHRRTGLGNRHRFVEAGDPQRKQSPTGHQVRPGSRLAGSRSHRSLDPQPEGGTRSGSRARAASHRSLESTRPARDNSAVVW